MRLSRHHGYALARLGVLLCVFPFGFGGMTLKLCVDVGGVFYDAFGVDPAGFRVATVDLAELRFGWHDGCNSRSSSLVPLLLGVPMALGGFAVVLRSRSRMPGGE